MILGIMAIGITLVALVVCLAWLASYSTRRDVQNGSPWGLGVWRAHDSTVSAYRRQTLEHQRQNEARVETARATATTHEGTTVELEQPVTITVTGG